MTRGRHRRASVGRTSNYPRYEHLTRELLRKRRKYRQFFHVTCVVLNDDGRLQIRSGFLQPLDRRDCLRTIEVECRHAARVVILAEVDRIAGDDDGAHLCKLYQQAGMARCVPWRTQHDHRTVTEYIFVDGLRLDLV